MRLCDSLGLFQPILDYEMGHMIDNRCLIVISAYMDARSYGTYPQMNLLRL